MGTIDFREMWVDPSWAYPPILIATLISSILIAFVSIRLIKLLIWLRAQAVPDRIGKYLVISLFPVSYIVIGIFQFWLGGVLYRDYCEADPGTNLHIGIPIHPVWLVGILSAVIYGMICRSRHKTRTARTRFESGSSK